ncbi:hypothetical protein [Qipengyuania sp. SM2507]
MTDVEQAILNRVSQPPPPRRVDTENAAPPIVTDTSSAWETNTTPSEGSGEVSVERIVENLARQDGTLFRSPSSLWGHESVDDGLA